MAGAFSGHLLHSYYAMNPSLVTSGAMSFNPTIHGTPMPSMSFFGSQMPFVATPYANESMSEETAMRIAALQVKLDQKLGPEYVSQRQGPRGGPKLTYAEGWKMINLANEVFGFTGWSSSLVNMTTDFVDCTESGRYNVGVTAVVRVTLREGVYHEDVGYGTADNSPSKGQALDKCKKEAVTDGLKRALRNFGNLMGNCLYDKAYTQEVVKIKVTPAKFDKSELHRRPEFSEEAKPQINRTENTTRPPVPLFNANVSTSSSALASTSGQGAVNGARNSLPNGRPPVVNARPSTTTTNNAPSSNSNCPAQSAYTNPNQNNRPPQSHQHQPPQAQNRRVSFAEIPGQGTDTSVQNGISKPEPDDDNFDFGDDDIFLAALGMEESDLGRPIETDADMGPPLDPEESFLPPEDDANFAVSDISAADISVKNISRPDKAARIQRLQEIINAGADSPNSKNPLHTTLPLQQSTPTVQMQNASSAASASARAAFHNSRSGTVQPVNGMNSTHQAPNNHQPSPQQRNHRPFARPQQQQNQNENPNPVVPNVNESGAKRSQTLSMGGFHFPPGMKSLQQHNDGSNGIGIKRPADAMSSNSSSSLGIGMNSVNDSVITSVFRSARPGMGLMQAIPQQRREPFAPLEIGQGGDVKRVKR